MGAAANPAGCLEFRVLFFPHPLLPCVCCPAARLFPAVCRPPLFPWPACSPLSAVHLSLPGPPLLPPATVCRDALPVLYIARHSPPSELLLLSAAPMHLWPSESLLVQQIRLSREGAGAGRNRLAPGGGPTPGLNAPADCDADRKHACTPSVSASTRGLHRPQPLLELHVLLRSTGAPPRQKPIGYHRISDCTPRQHQQPRSRRPTLQLAASWPPAGVLGLWRTSSMSCSRSDALQPPACATDSRRPLPLLAYLQARHYTSAPAASMSSSAGAAAEGAKRPPPATIYFATG